MKQSKTTLVLATSLAMAAQSQALDFDFSGTFVNDNDVVRLVFTLGAPSEITIFSSSWLSGDPLQGFDPILAIWDSSGTLIEEQNDGENIDKTLSNGTLYSHGKWDSYYSVTLDAGTYSATIAQFANFVEGAHISAGFRFDGNPNFTFDEGYGGATQQRFNGDFDESDPRTPDWAFHILNVDSAVQAPDGGTTLVLLGGALTGLGVLRRKFRG